MKNKTQNISIQRRTNSAVYLQYILERLNAIGNALLSLGTALAKLKLN